MAYSEFLEPITLVANADLSAAASQYKFVKVVNASGEGRAALAGNTEQAIGTLYEGDIAGRPCKIGIGRVIKCKLNATLAAGAAVMSDANGLAVAVSSGHQIGILLQGGVAGDVVSMLFQPIGTT